MEPITIKVPPHYIRIAHALQPLIALNGTQQQVFSSSYNIRIAFADACEMTKFALISLENNATRIMNDLFLDADVSDYVILDRVDNLKKNIQSLFEARALIKESTTLSSNDTEAKELAIIVFNDLIMQIQHWLSQVANTILYPQQSVNQNIVHGDHVTLEFNLAINLRPEFEQLRIWASNYQFHSYQQVSKPTQDNFWRNVALVAIGFNLFG